ncbi:unnamed protein product, partial [Adineta steineri]
MWHSAMGQQWLGCLVASCCTVSGLITIGAVVAIALIPIYLSTRDVTAINKGTVLRVTFSTNFMAPPNTTRPVFLGMQDFAEQVQTAGNIESGTLTTKTMQFTNEPNSRRRRDTSSSDTNKDAPLPGDFLQVEFLVSIPKQCGGFVNSNCAIKSRDKATNALRGLSTFEAMVQINGSAPFELQAKFYSFTTRITSPTCTDNIHNEDETDVDCGGRICSACADTKSCLVNADCSNNNCNATTKTCF